MATYYSNDPGRFSGGYTSHDPGEAQTADVVVTVTPGAGGGRFARIRAPVRERPWLFEAATIPADDWLGKPVAQLRTVARAACIAVDVICMPHAIPGRVKGSARPVMQTQAECLMPRAMYPPGEEETLLILMGFKETEK